MPEDAEDKLYNDTGDEIEQAQPYYNQFKFN